jgi:hypothetical protein
MLERPAAAVTAYELLGVHPSAPIDLVGAGYWMRVKQIREQDIPEGEKDAALHRLSLAYQQVSNPARRPAYNASIAYSKEPLTLRPLAVKRGFLGRKRVSLAASGLDPYEVMGLDPTATIELLPEAYRIMRDQYLRAGGASGRREALLALLDEAFAVLSDEEKRESYNTAAPPAAVAPVPISDRERPQPILAPVENALVEPTPSKLLAEDEEHAPEATSPAEVEQPELLAEEGGSPTDDSPVEPAMLEPPRPEEPEADVVGEGAADATPSLAVADETETPGTDREERGSTKAASAAAPGVGTDAASADSEGESAVSHLASSGTALILGGAKAAQRLVGGLTSKGPSELPSPAQQPRAAPAPPRRMEAAPPKQTQEEVEDVLLGRLASSVRETEESGPHDGEGDGAVN